MIASPAEKTPANLANGFTLIEMLVVMAIMGILVSILVPVLGGVEGVSETVTCQSNMKQLCVAMLSFQTDRGVWPQALDRHGSDGVWRPGWVRSAHGGSGLWSNWARWENVEEGSLWEFTKTRSIYQCPTFARTFHDANPNTSHLEAWCTYSLNEYLSPGHWQGIDQVLRNQIKHPAKMGVLAEEYVLITPHTRHLINNLAYGPGNIRGSIKSDQGAIIDGMGEFHGAPPGQYVGGKTHVAFADGHVELRPPTDSKIVFTPWFEKNRLFPAQYP